MDISAIFSTMQAEISLAVILIIMLLADLILKQPNHKALQGLACGLLVVQIALNIVPVTGEAFGGMFVNTSMSSIVKTVLTAGTLLVFMQADSWINREDSRHKAGEFYVLTLSTLLGMYYMVSAGSFLLFYVGLELASIPLACLVAFDKYRHHSAEAGTKRHVLFCPDALRLVAHLRHMRNHVFCRYDRNAYRNSLANLGNGTLLCRLRLQAELGSLPHVDSRYLPRRTHFHHSLSVCYLKRCGSLRFDEHFS